jgi:ElaB/YqjD/DUF883 family membrane-anchored ribosome-binding protein
MLRTGTNAVVQLWGNNRGNGSVAMNTLHAAANQDVIGAQFKELFADVDELIRRVADTDNPEIRRIRAQVYKTSVVAKSALERSSRRADTRPPVAPRTQPVVSEESPLAVALLLGLGLGLLSSSDVT